MSAISIAPDIKTIEKLGYREVFVAKKTNLGLTFPVEVSPDPARKGYVFIKRATRQWLHFLNKHIVANPETIPSAGDFLISANGVLLGILLDDNTALLITNDSLRGDFSSVDISSNEAFLKSIGTLSLTINR